jgi:outer membrane protein OmpA-like peptidoglycan-associated protein
MRTLLLILLFSLISSISYSQKSTSINDIRNVYDEKGDYYFDKNEFKKAIVYYNMAYNKDANNYYSILRKAEAFTSLEMLDQAAECYRIIFEKDLFIPNEYRLKYANLLLKNKDIKGFENWMGKYNEIVINEIRGYVSSTEARAKMYKDSLVIIVENESALNTPESEICPVIYKDQVVFASSRRNLSGNSGNDYYNLFSAQYLADGQLGRLNKFNKSLNSKQNESSISFSESTNKMYFTRSASTKSNLKTYVTSIPRNVNENMEVNEFSLEGFSSIGHVSFNKNGTKLYFVSDAPGGSGGLDIYTSELVGGKWSKPQNMGTNINSSKDEMYPFVLNDSILYFSSAGYNGLGGLDLYSVKINKENSTPKNLGNKINSKYDDYGLCFSPEGLTGYFCSNRPGGLGKEDIYRLQLLELKVKYAAYKFKRKTLMEDNKINLYLSNGDEYNIASEDKTGFNFSFQPEEAYKMVIQHENVLASNILNNANLTADQRKKEFLNPSPIEKTEIKLQTGMKYQFTAGMKPLSNEYKNDLNEMAKEYQNSSSTIDLTALAKELFLRDGEIYTIRFVKDDSYNTGSKSNGASSLNINNEAISTLGSSFFIVLPLDIEVNFNIKTDIAYFKENYSPKKVGTVKVDAEPVYKEVPVKQSEGFPILVNTESFGDISARGKISATELTIVPGSMYILTLGKTGVSEGKGPEITVPLTKGVKYNLGTEGQSKAEYNKALAQMTAGQAGKNNTDEELIDISILSKELDVMSEDDIVFNLIPAAKIGSQTSQTSNVVTTLDVDGRKYYVTNMQKLQVNLKLDQNKKVNIQTDLAYVKENFESSTIAVKVDTTSFSANIKEWKKSIITDPVFDVIIVNFNLNEYSIRPDAKSILEDKVVQVLKGDSRLYVTIKGYTDALGDAAYNEKLSRNRAQTVKDFLASNGIGENRIRTFSFGESLALKDGVNWKDLSEEELQKHRKVEVVIYLPKK